MIYTIPAGYHTSFWPPQLFAFYDKKKMTRVVTFTEESVYVHDDPNEQEDHNKLFGLGYFDGFHHTDSARFGWWWDPSQNKMILTAYCYVSGQRTYTNLCAVDLNEPHKCTINFETGKYNFTVINKDGVIVGRTSITHNHNKKFSYQLRFYFGGTLRATKDIRVKMTWW